MSPEYERYLRSPQWFAKRDAALARAHGRCEVIGCWRPANHVHHKHYKNMFAETPDDLLAICNTHHRQLHSTIPADKPIDEKVTTGESFTPANPAARDLMHDMMERLFVHNGVVELRISDRQVIASAEVRAAMHHAMDAFWNATGTWGFDYDETAKAPAA